ncbi:hypothetical protein BDR26DRAFT_937471 [Obelidium mucronatum]|nr:hypothetical protein BDR26DRAFT_937471 [Obelidium mucronatum]
MKTKSIAAISFHAFLQTIALIAITAGFTVIYQNKDNNSKPHFTSYHGIIGATAYSVVTLVAVFGMGILWFPGLVFGSVLKAKKWNQVKEYSGFLALVLSAVAGGIGIYSYASLVEASKYGVLATVIIAMGFAILVPSTYPATKNVKAK